MNFAIAGAIVMACTVIGLHFLRFWKSSRDPFFLCFALAFWIQGLQWLYSGLLGSDSEYSPLPYVARLVAYGLIVVAIVQKNYAPRARRKPGAPEG